MRHLNFNLKNAMTQAAGCVKVFTLLTLLLTLGVGQMWADPWVKLDVSTGKQGTKTVGDKLNGGSDWWYNYQTNGGWSSDTDIQVLIGTSTSSYSTVNASWYADDGSNKKVHANIGSFTFDKSGIWYAVGKYKSGSTTAYTSGTSFTNNTSLSTSMSTSNSPYWEVTPPSVKSFTVSTTGSDILSGTGTSADPYIIAYNGSLVLTLSGSKNKTDANSSLQYNTSGTWNTTTSRTISSITSPTKTSVTVKMRCYNSTASLSGTESTKTIYYQAELLGGTITLTAGTGGKVSNDNSSWGSSATITGITTATDKNIYAQANSGYSFNTWTKTSGSGTIKTNAASGVFTTVAGADAALTASFTENMRSVTISVSPSGAGTLNKTSASVGVATTTTVTATAQPGYRFTGWTATNCSVASTSSASTTLSGNGSSGSGTLVANFSRTYAYVQGRMTVYNSARTTETHTASSKGGWDENSTRIAMDYDATNHWFYRHTYKTPAELKAQISSNDQWFSIARSNASGSWSGKTTYHPSANTDLTTTGSANKKAAQTSTTTYNYKFNSSTTTGYVILYFDEAGVWYELEHTLKYNANGGTGSAPATTYYNHGVNATAAAANTFSRDGYTFSGWNTAANGSGTGYAAGASVPMTSNITLYAQWSPVAYTVTLSYSGEDHYGSAGSGVKSSVSATYDADMPAMGTAPTAANGYKFYGYYSGHNGGGTKYYNPNGSSAHKWTTAGTGTLYAFFKQGEISNVNLSGTLFEPVAAGGSKVYIGAGVSLDPIPEGSYKICWELRYNNDNNTDRVAEVVSGDSVRFELNGLSPGAYKIHAELRTGSTCGAGTLLSEVDQAFSIASDHTVTVEYRLGSATGDIIKASTTNPGKPLEWTSITAPTITGYSFTKWKAGDGITINGADANGEKASTTIQYKANYDGKLIAIYAKKRMIYFYNTLGWSSVNVYFYKNDSYWNNSNGTGSCPTDTYTNTPFSESKYGAMTKIAGTDIWYFDVEAAGVNASYDDVVFTEYLQYNYHYFSYKSGTSTPNKVVRRGDYKSSLPMFVPLADQTVVKKNSNQACYYNEGYWMNYPENTGYTLRIYDTWDANNSTGASREYPFPFSEDTKMPLKLDVEFNFTGQVWFMIYRNDGQLLGKNYTMNQNYHETDLDSGSSNKIEIKTSAPGVYKFTLSFLDVGSSTYKYYVYVEYPVGIGDYRILYKDGAKWSQSTAHNSSWWHESNIIHKNTGLETKADTVSLYVAYGSSPSAKFQYVSAINASTGAVTWSDVASGTVSLSDITKKGVYNFIVSQPAGGASISLTKKELYDGNYYIRTDKAGNTKWDNFRARDHQMTYTEFSNSDANAFGDKFTHYYAKWCPAGTNVKFVVANDYSDCISDTLIQDIGNKYKNIDAGGFLLSDNNPEETQNRYSANIRFMYNEETNKISRAYVASSTNAARYFLVLYCESGKTILDDEGNPLDGTGESEREAIFQDKENFIYERILEITPNTRFKLYASYALLTPHQYDSVQYFAGTYSSGNFNASSSVILISGTGDRQKLRVIYDFKTNRLVAAWIPTEGVSVSGNMDIDADVMVLRDHQKAAECITFNTGAKLTDVKTVYGAMKFNRWTLSNRKRGLGNSEDNNKDHCNTPEAIATYHAILPAGEQKSIYERSLYFVSFPFDVKLSEVFGFGNYWDEWYIEYYDGLNRAKNGYWMDSPPNWKFVTPEMYEDFVLNAYEGYILGLDLDFMGYDNTTFWANNISNVELYFPSREQMGTIQTTNVTIPALNTITGDPYRCTINRGTEEGDRRFKDSYWRCIGVPSYNEYAGTLTSNGSTTINWHSGTDYTDYFPFLYAWNMNDNTLTAQTGTTFPFKPMHAYLTQVPTAIYWTNVSATPSSIVARQRSEEQPKEFSWRLALIRNEQEEDQAYIRMANLEQVTDTFDFGQDLMKELNNPRSNIYSYIGYERVAANSMPIHTEGITIPLGLNIINAGEYTFSMPDGTQGVGITLVDSEANTRTSLSALDYTVTLEKGDYNDRFFLEISPINYIPTGVENGEVTNGEKGARKVLINGLLYIVRDGKMFDARGVRVE